MFLSEGIVKIEIAENLVYSYLKHIEGCRIVQTNWKTSGKWNTTEYDEKQANDLFERINRSNKFKTIFGKNSFKQLIKQAEIDILGLNTTENSIFGIDVAFHSGLNYKGVEGSTQKVLMKIFRTIFIMQSYFSGFDKFNSFFVAPKVNPSTYLPIKEKIEMANSIIADELITIKFIANNDFYENLVDPLLISIKNENDTGELFSRAIKLIQLDPRSREDSNIAKIKKEKLNRDKITENGMRIGQYVQDNVRKLFEEGYLTKSVINKLQEKEYSKKTFDQNYEFLRSSDKGITGIDGRNRYYTGEIICGNYYLTSQWVERHWKPFKMWIEKLRDKTLD